MEPGFCYLYKEDAIDWPIQCVAEFLCTRGPKICQGKIYTDNGPNHLKVNKKYKSTTIPYFHH